MYLPLRFDQIKYFTLKNTSNIVLPAELRILYLKQYFFYCTTSAVLRDTIFKVPYLEVMYRSTILRSTILQIPYVKISSLEVLNLEIPYMEELYLEVLYLEYPTDKYLLGSTIL